MLRGLRDRAHDPARGAEPVDRQDGAAPSHPRFHERVRDERKATGFVTGLVEERLGQSRLEAKSGTLRGPFDGTSQLTPSHRADQHLIVADAIREPRKARALRVEVRAERDDHTEGRIGSRRQRRERVEERVPTRRVDVVSEDFLKLVDGDEDGLLRGEQPARASRVGGEFTGRERGSIGNEARELFGQRFEGVGPGVEQSDGPVLAPRQRAPAIAGTSPARNSEDFPLPEGPPITRTFDACSRATNSSTSDSRPQKNAASCAWNAARPLYGHVAPDATAWNPTPRAPESSASAASAAASHSAMLE